MNIEKKEWLRDHWPVLDLVSNAFDMPPYMIYDMWEDINYEDSAASIYTVKRLMCEYSRQHTRRRDFELLRASLGGCPDWNPLEYELFLNTKAELKRIDAQYEKRNIIR